ncbi:hypothetical protein, partial [Pseudomonas syringae group genomosp. 7]
QYEVAALRADQGCLNGGQMLTGVTVSEQQVGELVEHSLSILCYRPGDLRVRREFSDSELGHLHSGTQGQYDLCH